MRSPAFQFYARDFFMDENVRLMTNQQVGIYIKLLCFCWLEGSIPKNSSAIAKLCDETETAMAQLWPAISKCFEVSQLDDERLVNKRLDAERKKQQEFSDERKKAGKRGAKISWNHEIKTDSSAIAEPMAKNSSAFASASASSTSNTIKHTAAKAASYTPAFESFWKEYPRKSGKVAAFKSWASKGCEVHLEAILKALAWQKRSKAHLMRDQEFIALPATWLNQGRWGDENPSETVYKEQNAAVEASFKKTRKLVADILGE